MSNLENIAKVAYELVRNPALHDVFQATHPQVYEDITALIQSPFYRWQPFGERGDPGTAQYSFCRSNAKNKWATAGNRGGKTIAGLMENVADCLQLDIVTKQPSTRYSHPPHMWVVSDTEETLVNIIWLLVELRG